jgi:hypothetical protein
VGVSFATIENEMSIIQALQRQDEMGKWSLNVDRKRSAIIEMQWIS